MTVRLLAAIIAAVFFAAPTGGAATEEGPDPEAAAFVSDLLSRTPPEDLALAGQLKTRDARGNWLRVPIQYTVKLNEDRWEGIYEIAATNAIAGERLVVVHQKNSPNRYLYWRGLNPGQPPGDPTRLNGEHAAISFAGTEFWLADLGLEFLHWPRQRLVREAKIKMMLGRPCKVLESINPAPSSTNYARVVSWVDSEYGGLIHAEAFDLAGKKIKVFSVKAFFKKAQVQELRILNEKTDTRTYLEFKTEPP